MLSPIEWEPKFETGHHVIDTDHQHLFDVVNELVVSTNSGFDPWNARKALNKARSYASYHFNHEEKIMRRAKYPDIERHTALHSQYIMTISEMLFQYNNEVLDQSNLTRYLVGWISDHILVHDRELGEFLKSI